MFTLGTLQEAHLAFGMFLRRYEEDMAETGRLPDWKCSDTSDEAESMFGMFPRPYDEDVVLTYRLCCTEQQVMACPSRDGECGFHTSRVHCSRSKEGGVPPPPLFARS